MKVFKEVKKLQAFLSQKQNAETIGLVPTMGALHKGHLSLITIAQKENTIVVVSIFVNPTQFNNTDDLLKYPKTLKADLELLKNKSKIIVFAPSVEDVYPDGEKSESFDFGGIELEMEGKFRLGHFDGVGTIVKRLFEIVNPTNAYFGEKDFQQLQIIKKMVTKLNLSINIVSCPIFREPSGLAMSSRNERLSVKNRKEASFIYKSLQKVKLDFKKQSLKYLNGLVEKTFKNNSIFELEYFTIADIETLKPVEKIEPNKEYRAFIAVFVENVRLIDNIAL
jgi:pantoate--beta-alanine ligase